MAAIDNSWRNQIVTYLESLKEDINGINPVKTPIHAMYDAWQYIERLKDGSDDLGLANLAEFYKQHMV